VQKKLIALTVAGLLSAPVFAQSSMTLFGSLDYGYLSLGNNSQKGVKGRNALDSGLSKVNRIGFKGTEDLGNGLKAVFVLENGVTGDIQASAGFLNSSNRQSYAGLSGGFGTVAFGRQHTPQHNFTCAVDPFDKTGLGSVSNVLVQESRLNNLATYTSPRVSGLRFVAAYSFHGMGEVASRRRSDRDEAVENNADLRVWAIAPSFIWKKLFVAGNYHTAKVHYAHAKNIAAFDVYDLYTSYDFGFVKLGATVGRRTTKTTNFSSRADRNSKITQWMIGATFKITDRDSILSSYSRASENKVYDSQDSGAKISQWAIGYEHALSKRTALYAHFAKQSHNDAFKEDRTGRYKPGFGSELVLPSSVGSVASNNYRRGFAVGFRHSF